jgi:hypothetical protein
VIQDVSSAIVIRDRSSSKKMVLQAAGVLIAV